jgi:hypothetical protein
VDVEPEFTKDNIFSLNKSEKYTYLPNMPVISPYLICPVHLFELEINLTL